MEDSKIYGQQNFNLPHDVLTLPSQGKFYKNKKKSIKVGYLTAQDENILISAQNNDNVIQNLIKSKVYEPEFNPKDLLEGDLEAILIFLRNTSFGPEYNFLLKDPKDGKEFEATVRLDELDYAKPKNEPNQNGFFELTLPKSNAKVECKLLTIGEVEEVNKLVDSYPKGVTPPLVTTRLLKQIHSVNGETDKGHISSFINNLPINDSKFIRNTLSESEPRLDLRRKVYAPSGEEVSVRVTFGVEFFRPFF